MNILQNIIITEENIILTLFFCQVQKYQQIITVTELKKNVDITFSGIEE